MPLYGLFVHPPGGCVEPFASGNHDLPRHEDLIVAVVVVLLLVEKQPRHGLSS